MKALKTFLFAILFIIAQSSKAQNVGIGTISPAARLHVTDSNVIFSTNNDITGNGFLGVTGAGTRLMWVPFRGAFRAGTVDGNHWDKDSIGFFSHALGGNTKALGTYAISAGFGNIARARSSTALGESTNATAFTATALGYQTTASGGGSIAAGQSTNSIGQLSVALGSSTKAIGDGSLSMGLATVAKTNNSLVLGRFNDTLNAGASLFAIGNGSSLSTRRNAFTVFETGNTDIAGYTRLGKEAEGAPKIKMKKIVVPIGPVENANMNIPFNDGITDNKVLAVNALLTYPGGTWKVPPSYTDAPGYEYNIQVQFNGITIINKNGNSFNIGARPITLLVTYEE